MSLVVTVRERGETAILSRRMAVRLSEIGERIGSAFAEAYTAIGPAASGPPFVIYEGMPHEDDPFDIEICVPLSGAVAPPSGWLVRTLPAGLFASGVHVGPYDTVSTTHEPLGAWIAGNGLAIAGPPREVYLSPPTVPPEQIRTIVEFPVSRVAVPV
jgi:effector-binding domain-containing protein